MTEIATRLRADLVELGRERDELRASLREMQPVVEAQRQTVSASGSLELGHFYSAQADEHRRSWKVWLVTLVATVAATAFAGASLIAIVRPAEDASDAELVSAVALELLVVDLLVYLVRIAALQFRVHRHLEAVARNKAAALATFSRMVAGQSEPDVRAAIALALAQSVFDPAETGFIGTTADHVTLVERLAAPAAQRLKQ